MAESALGNNFEVDDRLETPASGEARSLQTVTNLTGPERVLRTIASAPPGLQRNGGGRPGGSGKDGDGRPEAEWIGTLELVQEACESIRFSEERVALLEGELEDFARQSRDDMRTMMGRLSSFKEELKAANARAKAAEDRALEAENWLARINEAIRDGFGPYLQKADAGGEEAQEDAEQDGN